MTGQALGLRAAADDAAAKWLLLHEGLLSDAEAKRFEEWLAQSPINAEAWRHAQSVWASFDEEPDPLLLSIQHSARTMRRPAWRVLPTRGIAMAASILLCLGLVGWGAGVIPGQKTQAPIAVAGDAERYEAGAKRTEVVLRDGSRVLLDAHSAISVRETSSRRDIALLDGQAFFRVIHDTTRPFVVAASGRTVTATGTAFAVSVLSDTMSVVLEEGTVTVASQTSPAVSKLTPGQSFVASGGRDGVVSEVDVAGVLSWRTGYIELHNVTIGEAVERMNRYSKTPVTVGDAQAGALRITGEFRTDDPIRFVEALSEMYPIRIRRGQGGAVAIVSVKNRKER